VEIQSRESRIAIEDVRLAVGISSALEYRLFGGSPRIGFTPNTVPVRDNNLIKIPHKVADENKAGSPLAARNSSF
jgi:hypothetical protein